MCTGMNKRTYQNQKRKAEATFLADTRNSTAGPNGYHGTTLFWEIHSLLLRHHSCRHAKFSMMYPRPSSILDDLKKIRLHPQAKLFTADTVSMYTNTAHGLHIFEQLFQRFKGELPNDFPTSFSLKCLRLVMTNNLFQFGDNSWIQLRGTAMGTCTSCACLYLYYAWDHQCHIRHQLPFYPSQVRQVCFQRNNGICIRKMEARSPNPPFMLPENYSTSTRNGSYSET